MATPEAPTTWAAPSSGGEATGGRTAYALELSYVNGYWISLGIEDVSGTSYWYLRTASDPSGTWTERAIPELASMTSLGSLSEFYYDGTYYSFAVGHETVADSQYETYVYYATDPTGTWSSFQLSSYSASTEFRNMSYSNGYWAITGVQRASNPWLPVISYSTSLLGTWSHNVNLGGTGDWTAVGAPAAPIHDGTNWIIQGPGKGLFYASSLSSTSWTSCGSVSSEVSYFKKFGNYIVCYDYSLVQYATSATSTWTSVSPTTMQLSGVQDITYNGRYWCAVGSNAGTPRVTYCDSPYPLGTSWSLVTTGSGTGGFGSQPEDITSGTGWIAASAHGATNTATIRWASNYFAPPDACQADLGVTETSLGIFNPPTKPIVCQVDLSTMTAADVVTIRCYTKTGASTATKKVLYSQTFSGVQVEATWQSVPVENPYYVEFTAIQPTGSSVRVDYFVQEVLV